MNSLCLIAAAALAVGTVSTPAQASIVVGKPTGGTTQTVDGDNFVMISAGFVALSAFNTCESAASV